MFIKIIDTRTCSCIYLLFRKSQKLYMYNKLVHSKNHSNQFFSPFFSLLKPKKCQWNYCLSQLILKQAFFYKCSQNKTSRRGNFLYLHVRIIWRTSYFIWEPLFCWSNKTSNIPQIFPLFFAHSVPACLVAHESLLSATVKEIWEWILSQTCHWAPAGMNLSRSILNSD